MECAAALRDEPMKEEAVEDTDMVSSVIRAKGETLGQVDMIVQMSKLNDTATRKLENKLTSKRCPVLVLKGYKPKPAVKLCQTQQIMGEFYLWEYPASKDCQAVDREMRAMGARKMKVEGQVSWTNSTEIEKAVGEELDKTKILMDEGRVKADRTRSECGGGEQSVEPSEKNWTTGKWWWTQTTWMSVQGY